MAELLRCACGPSASTADGAPAVRLWEAAIERALLAHRRGDVHYDCR